MSAAALRVYRLMLLLYPAEFRRRYGDDMVQLVIDRRRHEARPTSLILLDETLDAVRAAPRMRWESSPQWFWRPATEPIGDSRRRIDHDRPG